MSARLKLILAFSAIAFLFAVFAVINILIGVREIEVRGIELCTRDEILSIAGIKEESGYFSYNTSEAEQKIKEIYPCVTDIRISRSMFGKVTVSVTEEKAFWYVESYNEYFALSMDLRVIKSSEERNRFIECGLVRIDFPEVRSAVLGNDAGIVGAAALIDM
jgi:cell division septal protein FtsQ